MWNRLFENFVRKATDWWFRVTTIERFLIGGSLALIGTMYAGQRLLEFVLRIAIGAVPDGVLQAQERLDAVDGWILTICSVLLLVGVGLAILRFSGEAKARSKKRVLVIEGRGLRDDDGSPLSEAAGKDHDGNIIPVLLDLRNRMDGKVTQPEVALEDIAALHRSVLQYRRDGHRTDLTTIYGGLTSVPYTFLTGVLLDDEGTIVTYDWDRAQEAWRGLDDEDDGLAFSAEGLKSVAKVSEVVVAVAFSYPVADDDLESTFPHPVVRLTLDGMSSEAHWSQKKQNRLAQQFLEAMKQLSATGVKRVHLVMAAPNSVTFTFGRRYDKRNLPEIVVYQYERGSLPAYPWGVLMPTAGVGRAEVLYSDSLVQPQH
jgi:hypothetical protein